MNNQIVPGSIGAIAKQSGKSIAETFVSADVIVLVDVSGSMNSRDSRGGRSRYDVACEELRQLQNNLPGKIAVVGFSDYPEFAPSGVPYMQNSTTAMVEALKFVHIADVPGIRFILISDGEPNNEKETLKVAATFKNKIDVIFVGPEERPYGRDFLQRLAAATGGKSITVDRAKELNAGIMGLLECGSV
jgi:hypothetical protein